MSTMQAIISGDQLGQSGYKFIKMEYASTTTATHEVTRAIYKYANSNASHFLVFFEKGSKYFIRRLSGNFIFGTPVATNDVLVKNSPYNSGFRDILLLSASAERI